jgi:hypothetical protein
MSLFLKENEKIILLINCLSTLAHTKRFVSKYSEGKDNFICINYILVMMIFKRFFTQAISIISNNKCTLIIIEYSSSQDIYDSNVSSQMSSQETSTRGLANV